ncbi:Cytosolic carboxypeptidase 1 [Seminavis robusta]|uniref:Cytosolic carboxypeptidase 1 n=1 Tax=Seminavis robusta TaxID=568900 RepID=A0A9N8EWL0_9STRA|nr:Cytosolic carboxypeptidase 1 [Seminavis robusta]|eukprot:Sro2261_g321150.1 Cytosolic carboxypeptidase 1 (473) ;mRNA; f:4075-5664
MPVTISISDTFDGGNIKFVEQRVNPDDASVIDVIAHIKPDVYTELEEMAHMQYFAFRVTLGGLLSLEQEEQKVNYILANAQDVSYPEAWSGTTVFYGSDLDDVDGWKRNLTTHYGDGKLSWQQTHTRNGSLYFSYFPPFSYARHLKLISQCTPHAQVGTLGQSLEGREMEFITIGSGSLTCWIIHRQHPGETMAEHYAEGLLHRLLGIPTNGDTTGDKVVQEALQKFTFYIVPCMCPDGSVKGHLRTNACGANLNREWATVKPGYTAPSLERSPEVYHVLHKMDETGVDVCIDVHGDEELPFNFISGAELIPAWGPRLQALHGAFVAAYGRSNNSMQAAIGYPPPESAEMVLRYMNVATNQISQRFNCLAVTLEMPFKDCLTTSDPDVGWNPAQSRKLGATVLEALVQVHPLLRDESEFWKTLPAEDAYVTTTDDYESQMTSADKDEPQFKMLKKRFYSDVHEIHKQSAANN